MAWSRCSCCSSTTICMLMYDVLHGAEQVPGKAESTHIMSSLLLLLITCQLLCYCFFFFSIRENKMNAMCAPIKYVKAEFFCFNARGRERKRMGTNTLVSISMKSSNWNTVSPCMNNFSPPNKLSNCFARTFSRKKCMWNLFSNCAAISAIQPNSKPNKTKQNKAKKDDFVRFHANWC